MKKINKLQVHFIEIVWTDGIGWLKFRHLDDFYDAVKCLDSYKAHYTTFFTPESEFNHIFLNEAAYNILKENYS